MHLYDEGMVVLLHLFENSPLSHYLGNFVVSLNSILPHYFHCIDSSCDFMPHHQNLGKASFTNDLFYLVVRDIIPS